MIAATLVTQPLAPMPLSACLRAATRALHDRAEALMPLLQHDLTCERYLQHLQALWPVVYATEMALAPWHADLLPLVGDRLALQPRAPLLRSDLHALAPQGQLAAGVVPQASPSLPHAVGCWYVLAGARLGGQVIAQRVTAALGLRESMGLAFYGACSRGDGTRFRAFLRAIDSHPDLAHSRQQTIFGATETFERYCRALLPETPLA